MALGALPKVSSVAAKTFVDILVHRGLLPEKLRGALAGKDLEQVDQYLLQHHPINPDQLAQAYADFYHLPYQRLINRPVKPEVVKLLPEDVARRYVVLPFAIQGLELDLAIGEPSKLQENAPAILVKLRQQKGLRVKLFITSKADILALLAKVYSGPQAAVSHQKPSEQKKEVTKPAEEKKPSPAPKAVVHPEPPKTTPVHPPSPQIPAHHQEHHEPPPETKKPTAETQSSAKPSLVQKPVVKTIDLRTVQPSPEVMKKIPYSVAKKHQLLVFEEVKPKSQFEPALIKVAAVDLDSPHVQEILSYIEHRNKVLLDRYQTTPESFAAAIAKYPPQDNEEVEITSEENVLSPAATPPKITVPDQPKPTAPITVEANTALTAPAAAKSPVVQAAPKPVPVAATLPEGMVLSTDDIINRPSTSQQSPEELARLAKEQQTTVEDRNLDKLLKKPITTVEELAEVFKSGVIPEIVAGSLFLAIRMQASDIHVEAEQENVRVRFRIDGILHDLIRVPLFLHAPLISRIKILSKMKIDEQRIPQDGRFDVVIDNRQVDLRVSTLPTVHGEKVVMRLLDKSSGVLTLEQLGVTGSNFDSLVVNIRKPYGIILSTGPTGSGKSTTLYAILSRISKPEVNIITLEDPVEYELPGLNQAQVKPQIGFTFAEGLRSVLRQDPNVIMVGEIRDLETAAMATHAALTGHLVLSTLHTNDSSGALPRLINMGVEPFLITSSLNAVIGQRLVRKICSDCREATKIPPAVLEYVKRELSSVPSGQLKDLNLEQLVFYHGRGCPNCTNGYRGRIGIYEVLPMSGEIEELAVKKAPATEIKKAAVSHGMITMTQDGLIKALKGITTVDEVMRVTTTEIKEVPGATE